MSADCTLCFLRAVQQVGGFDRQRSTQTGRTPRSALLRRVGSALRRVRAARGCGRRPRARATAHPPRSPKRRTRRPTHPRTARDKRRARSLSLSLSFFLSLAPPRPTRHRRPLVVDSQVSYVYTPNSFCATHTLFSRRSAGETRRDLFSRQTRRILSAARLGKEERGAILRGRRRAPDARRPRTGQRRRRVARAPCRRCDLSPADVRVSPNKQKTHARDERRERAREREREEIPFLCVFRVVGARQKWLSFADAMLRFADAARARKQRDLRPSFGWRTKDRSGIAQVRILLLLETTSEVSRG